MLVLIGMVELGLRLPPSRERERRLEQARQLRESARLRPTAWMNLRGAVGTVLIAWGEALRSGAPTIPAA